MKNIKVRLGTKKDFIKLSEQDFTNTYDTIFNIKYRNFNIKISEIKLKEPITNLRSSYSDEIKNLIIPKLNAKKVIPLIALYKDKPIGYTIGTIEQWPNGNVIIIDGILVAQKYYGRGIGKAMISKLIAIAKTTKGCRGIHAEMDTTKYYANKLLLKMGFQFAGTKFYIYSNDNPHKYSKDAIYFYYKIDYKR